MIVIKNMCYKNIVNNINLELLPGTITLLIGNSGAGKTTLLSCIAQLISDYTGTIIIKKNNSEQDIADFSACVRARTIGFIPQQYNLFAHLTVVENCAQPLRITLKLNNTAAQEKAYEKLALLGIEHLADKYPDEISGGQQQRVAIARALCFEPDILLFDEPTAALDQENSLKLIKVLQDLAASGKTIAGTSHDATFIKAIQARIYYLENGQIV